MSDNADLPQLPVLDAIDTKLPEPEEIKTEMTYDAPHILLGGSAKDGLVTHSIREAASVQVSLLTRIEYAEKPVDEHEKVFNIKARNLIKFAGQRVSVINDATEFGDVKLQASAPSASEYLKLVGKPVLIYFDCARDPMQSQRLGRPVFKIVRNSIVLP